MRIYPFDNAKSLRLRARCAQWWAGLSCSLLGIHCTSTGSFEHGTAYFMVSNHCSYLDILVIGCCSPSVFISKKEVASWPLFGWLTRLGGTVFVDRASKVASVKSFQEIKKRLNNNISVVLFPEGTTNDGITVMDFKSAFFNVPIETATPILPISLSYSHINREPVTPDTIDTIAWHGEMPLLPHFWNLLGLKRIDVSVHFHPALTDVTQDRKELSWITCKTVRAGCLSLRSKIP